MNPLTIRLITPGRDQTILLLNDMARLIATVQIESRPDGDSFLITYDINGEQIQFCPLDTL